MALTLVPKEPKPKRTKREQMLDDLAALAPPQLLKCQRCGCMEFLETRVGVEKTPTGKLKGGTKALVCLHCFVLRHERVEIK